MISITLSNKLPSKGQGILLDYQHCAPEADGWEIIDVRQVIAKHEDKWLDYVYKWHGDLQRKLCLNIKWYSLFPFSRLILWPTTSSFSLKPLFYLLAVIKILETRQKSIWIVNPDNYLKKYILEYSRKNNIPIIDQCFKNYLTSFINNFKTYYMQKITPLKEFIKLSYCLAFQPKRKIKKAHTVVSSLFFSEELMNRIGDHYFGHLFDNDKVVSKENICWIYNDLRLDKKTARMKLDKIGRTHYFLSDFFTWKDLFISFIEATKASRSVRKFYNEIGVKEILLNGYRCKNFSTSYFINLGLNWFPIFEFLICRIYTKAFNLLSPKNFIYPYEERPFERAMLIATELAQEKILSIAYAHAGYSKGHMYLKRQNGVKLPSPSVIALTGKAAKERFIFDGFSEKSLFIAGSTRHDVQPLSNNIINRKKLGSKLSILFICGLGYEMFHFANLLVKNPDLAIKYNIAIRRSFHSYKSEQDEAELLLNRHNISFKCADGALLEEINIADIILFESTSASFQASMMGKLIIQINVSDVLNTNFFVNHREKGPIINCKTANELEANLKFVNTLSKKNYKELLNKQKKKILDIYGPLNIKKMKKIFQS